MHRPRTSSPDRHGIDRRRSYVGSFNACFRDELLDGEISFSLAEAKTVIEDWRWHYNAIRPHCALGWRPPAPETPIPLPTRTVMH